MSQRLKSVFVFAALLCCFAVFKLLTHALVLSSFSQMIVDAELDHEDRLELFASPHARLQDYELVGGLDYGARFGMYEYFYFVHDRRRRNHLEDL